MTAKRIIRCNCFVEIFDEPFIFNLRLICLILRSNEALNNRATRNVIIMYLRL